MEIQLTIDATSLRDLSELLSYIAQAADSDELALTAISKFDDLAETVRRHFASVSSPAVTNYQAIRGVPSPALRAIDWWVERSGQGPRLVVGVRSDTTLNYLVFGGAPGPYFTGSHPRPGTNVMWNIAGWLAFKDPGKYGDPDVPHPVALRVAWWIITHRGFRGRPYAISGAMNDPAFRATLEEIAQLMAREIIEALMIVRPRGIPGRPRFTFAVTKQGVRFLGMGIRRRQFRGLGIPVISGREAERAGIVKGLTGFLRRAFGR